MSARPVELHQLPRLVPRRLHLGHAGQTVGGADNPFIPVTTLRQGLIAPAGAPDIGAGRIPLPRERRHQHLCGGRASAATSTRSTSRSSASSRRGSPRQAAYVGTRAIGQMNFVNVNAAARAPATPGGRWCWPASPTSPATSTCSRPYGDTVYDGLQTQLLGRTADAQGGFAYTLSKTTNYADNGGGNAAGAGGPRIQYLPEKERNQGLAGYDRTHNLQAFWAWDLPFGKNGRWANATGIGVRAARRLAAQRRFSSAMSGTPIYIIQNTALQPERARAARRSPTGSGQRRDLPRQPGEPAAGRGQRQPATSTSIAARTRRSTSPPASRSGSATRRATRFAGRASGTSTWGCSAASSSHAAPRSSASRR